MAALLARARGGGKRQQRGRHSSGGRGGAPCPLYKGSFFFFSKLIRVRIRWSKKIGRSINHSGSESDVLIVYFDQLDETNATMVSDFPYDVQLKNSTLGQADSELG